MENLDHHLVGAPRGFSRLSPPGLPPDAKRFGNWRPRPARREQVLPPLQPWQIRGNRALEWLKRLIWLAAFAALVGFVIFLWNVTGD